MNYSKLALIALCVLCTSAVYGQFNSYEECARYYSNQGAKMTPPDCNNYLPKRTL